MNILYSKRITKKSLDSDFRPVEAHTFLSMRFDLSSLLVALVVLMMAGYCFSLAGIRSIYIFYSFGYRFVPLAMGLLLLFYYTKGRNIKLASERKAFFFLIAVVLALSTILRIVSGKDNDFFLEGIFNLAYPMVFGYLVVNLFSAKQLYNTMVGTLIVAFIAYMVDLSNTGALSLNALASIDFVASYSPTESHSFSGVAFSLAAFFCYFNKRPIWTLFAVLFSLLTFKRVAVIFVVVLFIIGLFNFCKTIKNWLINLAIFITVLLTIGYYIILTPEFLIVANNIANNLLGIDSSQLTMGRNEQLSFLLLSGFESSGYNSSVMWLDGYLEMEFIRIYLELGIVGLIAFSVYFWKISRKNLYSFIFTLSIVTNLLFSWSFAAYVGWIIKYIVLYSVGLYDQDFRDSTYDTCGKGV